MLLRIMLPPGPPVWQIVLSVVLDRPDVDRRRLRRRQDLPHGPAHAGQSGDVRRDVEVGRAESNLKAEVRVMPSSNQLDSRKSPRFAQPATFMRLPHQTDLAGVDVAMLGVPYDSGTSYRRARASGRARSATSRR